MKVIGHEGPGKAIGLSCCEKVRQALNKLGFVVFINKDIPPFNTTDYHMLKQTWDINAG